MPQAVGNLSSLKKIRLLRCQELESLPDTIGNLRSLKTIYIRGGKMTALPESIGNISFLRGISLQYTNIIKLPVSIVNLDKLEYLGIYSYRNSMPWDYDFDNPPNYYEDETIEKRSPFNALPDSLSKLVSLKCINLDFSEVTVLPDFLANLPELEEININGCNISSIPVSIQRLIDNEEIRLFKSDNEFIEREWGGFRERKRPRRK